MKNIRFLSENVQFLEVKYFIYLNRCVFVMRQDHPVAPRRYAYLKENGHTIKEVNYTK